MIKQDELETYFDNVLISKMFVAEYGRPSSKTIVARLKQNFDIKAVGTLYLSYRDQTDTYAIIDGHHRMLAATECGFETLPARVYLGLTLEQEAYLYNLFATVNKQMALDRFRARLIAKEDEAISINEMVESIGLRIGLNGTLSGEILAIGELQRIITEKNLEHARHTLELLFDVYGLNAQAYRAELMAGVSAFLTRYESVMNRDRLLDVMHRHTPRNIFLKSQTSKSLYVKTDHKNIVGIFLMEEYNSGLRSGKLPAWKSRQSNKPYEFTEARQKAVAALQEKRQNAKSS